MGEYIENSINEYYKLKSNYENEINKHKKNIINNASLSWKEKKIEFQKLKPKCFNCKRPGGTIFSIKLDISTKNRHLKAICGVIANPCNLNIDIELGSYEEVPYILKDTEKDINGLKLNIIDDKNKLLFGYIRTDAALNNFNEIKSQISELTTILEDYLNEYNNVADNKERNDKLNESIEMSEIYIVQLKESIKQFNETNDIHYVNDALEIYNTNLKPLLKEIMNLKYRENMVWYNEDENTYHLIQNKYTISDMQVNLVNESVKQFNVGMGTTQQPTNKNKNKNKKATQQLIIEDEEESQPQTQIPATMNINANENINVPTIDKNGNITWSNPEYQKIWDATSSKFKNALLTDHEWLQEFMDSCVVLKQNKKPCKFIPPSNLILPPQILDDGKYDFGNGIYNDVFNKLDKSYQTTLLGVYSVKNGVKNYKMLEDALGNIVAKELSFSGFL
jgi:hypothetical protein